MKRKKKKLDEVFESYSFSDTNIASLFFREDAIKSGQKAEKEKGEDEIASLFDDSFDEPIVEEAPVEEPIVEEIPAEEPIVEEIPAEESIVEEAPAEESIVEEAPVEESIVEEIPAEEPIVEEAPAEEFIVEETPVEESIVEEIPVEETIVEEIPVEETIVEEISAEEPIVEEIPAEEPIVEEIPAEEPIVEEIPVEKSYDDSDPEALAALIAEAILSDGDLTLSLSETGSESKADNTEKESASALAAEACEEKAEQTQKVEKAEKAAKEKPAERKIRAERIYVPHDTYDNDSTKKKNNKKREKIFVMGDANISPDSRLPFGLSVRLNSRSKRRHIINLCVAVVLMLLVTMAVYIPLEKVVTKLAETYDMADPDKVVEQYIEYLSGTRLYNDVVAGVGNLKSEYESDKDAAGKVLEALHKHTEKNYFRVYSGKNVISYDVYSGQSKIYTLTLEKKAEVNSVFDVLSDDINIAFWDVKEISFCENSLEGYKKKIYVSAPKDATVYLNGIPLSEDMIADDDYSFFVGSVWESNVPEEARCVLYCVDGIFGDPTFTAYYEGEKLDMYADEQGVNHAKYPKDWVKDYTVSVPKGAMLYVNGVLATKVTSSGSAPATTFEPSAEGLTDVYLLESLFNDPSLHAYYDGVSLGTPEQNEEEFFFSYSLDMYHKTEITVPVGAVVKVNGVLLSAENSICESVSFAEWSKYAMSINSYMPSELKNAGFTMPEFEKYTVSMLYFAPTVEVSINGGVCSPYSETKQAKESRFMYDVPSSTPEASLVTFAQTFAKTYLKYITEGCYGIRDDVEMRKNFYTNWLNYLSYILPDTLCYDSALESYSDVEYRPNNRILTESYSVQNVIKYSDNVYACSIVCVVSDSGGDGDVISIINTLIVTDAGQYKIWMHDTIS